LTYDELEQIEVVIEVLQQLVQHEQQIQDDEAEVVLHETKYDELDEVVQ